MSPNRDFPAGFKVKRIDGSSCHAMEENKLAATHDAIGNGCLLEHRSDGFTHPAQATSLTICGISAEYKAANAGGNILFEPLTGQEVLEAQVSSNDVAAQTDLKLNYDIIATAPDATTKQSLMEIDGTSGATTATLPIKITKVSEKIDVDGNALGGQVVVECRLNHGAFKSGVAGI